uniref:Aquaporin family protein n=1 Tax=Philasterides dicentrarchi TaxID=282688 RepID=A0A481SCE9_9CILI|nr:aquaporin family protein [Philasterides dicentrarchi]
MGLDNKKTILVEFIGTFFLCLFILCARAYNAALTNGNWDYFLALSTCLFFSLPAYGDTIITLNPATMLTYLFSKKIEIKHFGLGVLFQFLGAFLAAGAFNLMRTEDPEVRVQEYASIPPYDTWTNIYENLLGSFIFMICIRLVSEGPMNSDLPKCYHKYAIALMWMACISSFCKSTRSPLNPALDLSPRIWSLFKHEGKAFEESDGYFWIPLAIPFGGTTLGWLFYEFIVDKHMK